MSVPSRVLALGLLMALMALAAGGCGSDARILPAQRTASPVARAGGAGGAPPRIAVVVMENEELGDVLGSGAAPYINRLAARGAVARQMYAIAHPSLPNYLALTGGSTFGITGDCTDCSVRASSLADQLDAAHVAWKAYMEGYPGRCFTGAGAGEYARKHNPFIYYTRIARSPSRCRRIVPLRQLSADERAGALPGFLWITPNLCHDMHDCDVATGDRFLSGLLAPLLRSLGPHGLLILTWDEGSSGNGCCRLASGGHILTVLAGPLARAGAHMTTPADHYSVLQTVDDLLHLPRLRGAACTCTPSLQPLLAGGGARTGAAGP